MNLVVDGGDDVIIIQLRKSSQAAGRERAIKLAKDSIQSKDLLVRKSYDTRLVHEQLLLLLSTNTVCALQAKYEDYPHTARILSKIFHVKLTLTCNCFYLGKSQSKNNTKEHINAVITDAVAVVAVAVAPACMQNMY